MAWWSRAQNIIGTRWLIFSSMYILLLSPTPQSSSLCLVLIWEVVRRNATSVPERQGINTEKSYASDLPSRCGWDLQRHLVFRKSDPEQARALWTRKVGPGCKYVCTTDCLAPWQGKPHPKQSSPVECLFPTCYVCMQSVICRCPRGPHRHGPNHTEHDISLPSTYPGVSKPLASV